MHQPHHKIQVRVIIYLILYFYVLDIDECTENLHNCHPNATCVNDIHPFTCHCKQGFSGDGVQCQGITSFAFLYAFIIEEPGL